MTRYAKLVACLVLMLCVDAALAQTAVIDSVAFIYVSSNPSQGDYQINGFAAAANGVLVPISGSPFQADVQNMALNGKYLFGTNGTYIYSFSIAPDGSLAETGSINAQQYNDAACGGPVALFLDHSGATLYDEDVYGNNCANNTYQFFNIDNGTGALTYLGMTSEAGENFWVPLSFIGNNLYAYGSFCYHFDPALFGFQRDGDGTLTGLKINPPMPAAQSGDFYCPYLSAEDPTNNLAVSVQELDGSTWLPVRAPQLATYTADNSGNLTTNSKFSNMPSTAVQSVADIWMSPSGQLLAVGGTGGLQVFHFNGSNPITHYTRLLTRDPIDQFFWDNANHLYAISRSAGKLYVFTITPTSVSQAPGSPHAISNPQNIIVLPKT
ncbi:MAG: hypothetical protein ACRD3L_10245 [Terriglobales bacterium]